MNTWQQTWNQLLASWNSFTTSQARGRSGWLCADAVCAGGSRLVKFAARLRHAGRRLSPTETAEVVQHWKPSRFLIIELRSLCGLGPQVIAGPGPIGCSRSCGIVTAEAETDLTSGIFDDPSQIHQNQLRQQESRLARSISQFRSIKSRSCI